MQQKEVQLIMKQVSELRTLIFVPWQQVIKLYTIVNLYVSVILLKQKSKTTRENSNYLQTNRST